jgi:hypothetical protein
MADPAVRAFGRLLRPDSQKLLSEVGNHHEQESDKRKRDDLDSVCEPGLRGIGVGIALGRRASSWSFPKAGSFARRPLIALSIPRPAEFFNVPLVFSRGNPCKRSFAAWFWG